MNFYLSAADDMLRHPDDKPSIGLILCKGKSGLVAEYAVRDIGKLLGISEFRHLEKLPEQLKGTLPTIEEIETELTKPEEPSSEFFSCPFSPLRNRGFREGRRRSTIGRGKASADTINISYM